MKTTYILLLIMALGTSTALAQRKTDLANIQFTENVQTLLKRIQFEKWIIEKKTVYDVVNKNNIITYSGISVDPKVQLCAQNNIIFSYYIAAEKTAITNRLLQALLVKYHQPTTKVKDNADAKAYYWQTPTLFIQFMSGKAGYDDIQHTCFIHVATLKALNAGADPDFKHVYDLFKAYK